MAAEQAPREVTSLLCDDVRQEVGNKPSLMGVYADSIVVPQMPVLLPRLVLFKSFFGGHGEYQLKLDVMTPDRTSLFPEPGVKDFGTVTADARWNVILGFAPVRLEKAGEYKAIVTLTNSSNPQDTHEYVHQFTVSVAK